VLFLKPIGLLYDFIMVDECQDMNKAERELVLKCFKMGTRLISVGDSNQMLYSFAGGDPDSFKALKSLPNTECLPLSISYRCPKNVVEFAQKLVPSIEYNESNVNDGFVKYDVSLSDVEDGDMILCRNNAPLIQIYNEFLKLGKKAFIRGKDIGANLKTLVKSIKQEKVNADCREDGLFVRLYDDLFVTRNKIMERSSVDAKTAMTSPIIENKLDMIKALEILAEGTNTTDELIAKIDEIFPKKDKKDGIALSTIHKAKGLEANNVYIACKSLMPSKSAKKDWELKQEHNLMYVAYTRAKNTLGFIDERDFKDFDLTNTTSQAKLDRIEAQVNKVLGKTTKIVINETTAKVIVDNAQKLDWKTVTPAKKTINISSGRTVNSFADLFKNKRQVKVKR
jgi:superfamily I DNA/RNA helicase